jgi:3-oxoacyl-[acyl-carrier protein] reductase
LADAVVITGASQGIGLATARLLAESGKTVIGIARSDHDQDFPGELVRVDLSDIDATAEALDRIAARHAIDGVVNNVGFNILEPVGSVDLSHFARVLDMNLRTTVQVTQAFLPGMKDRGYGRIVNLSSRGALGRAGRTSYGAAKAGVIGMTRTWALELATSGITANVVSPGPTATEMFRRNNLTGPGADARRRTFLADVAMNRFGEPEEIAFAIAFFLDRRASFITGQVLHACGGSSVGPAPL